MSVLALMGRKSVTGQRTRAWSTRFLDVMRPADTARAAYLVASDVRPGDDPAGVRRAFGERAPRDGGLCRRTARLPDRGYIDDMLAGTTASLATTGTRRIADDGSHRSGR
ncbi:MAG TPA: hypothetical protein VII16_07745 [Actinomycetes bacterium]